MQDHRDPAQRPARKLWIAIPLAAALAVAAVRCASSHADREPARTTAGATHGHEPASAPATAEPVEAKVATTEQDPRDAGAPTSVARLMRATDGDDRDLLAQIERQTHVAPPASAFELLELRRAGGSRAELERFIHEELEGGIPVRLAAMRWLRAVHGEPEPESDADLLRAPDEPDPGPRHIKPLTKKSR